MSFLNNFFKRSKKPTTILVSSNNNNVFSFGSTNFTGKLDQAPFICSIVNLYFRFLNQTSLVCKEQNSLLSSWNYAPNLVQNHSSFCNALVRGWINGLALIKIDRDYQNNATGLEVIPFDSINDIQNDGAGGLIFSIEHGDNPTEKLDSSDALVLPFNDNGNLVDAYSAFDCSNQRLLKNDLIALANTQNLLNNVISNYPSLFKLSGSVNSSQYKNVSEQIEQNSKVQKAVQNNLSNSSVISIPDGFDLTVLDNNNYLQTLSQLNASISQTEMNIANFFQVPIGSLSSLEHVHTANNSASDDYTFFYGAFSSLLRQIKDELNVKLGKNSEYFDFEFDGTPPTNPALKMTEQIGDNESNN